MVYNLSNATVNQNILDLFLFANEVSNGWAGIVAFALFFLVSSRALGGNSFNAPALAASLFLTAVISVPFVVSGVIPFIAALVSWVLLGAVCIWLLARGG